MGTNGQNRLLSLISKPTRAALLSLLILIAASPFSLADSLAPPRPYVAQSADGRFIFVMSLPRAMTWKNKIYSVSGLYRNDGSTEPLWTVDWYAFEVVVASDGSHVIRLGPWASAYDDEAFTFFSDGKEIKSYEIDDLVWNPRSLPRSVSHFSWLADSRLDDDAGTWSIRTLNGEYYKFSISTGEILLSIRMPFWILGIGAPLFVGILFAVLRRRTIAAHVIAMLLVSCVWTSVLVLSDGDISELPAGILLSLLLIGVAVIALIPAGVFWLLKQKYMPGTLLLMWTVWGLGALIDTYLLMFIPWGFL